MPNRLTESEKQLIHKLHEREHFIEEVANSTADVIYVLDLARGRIIYINKRVQTLMGVDNMQLDAIHPQDYEKRCRHLDNCARLKRDEVREIDLRFRVKSGAWNWFRVRDKAFKYNSDGNVLQVIGVVHDIHEQKKSEETLIEKERLFRGVLDAPNVGIVIMKAVRNLAGAIMDFEFVAMSKSFEAIYRRNDLAGKWVFETFPENKALSYDVWRRVVETGEDYAFDMPFEMEGQQRWLHLKYSKFDDGVISVWEDITAKKQNEEKLREQSAFISRVTEISPDVISIYDFEKHQLIFSNREIFQLLELPKELVENIDKRQLRDLIAHPDDRYSTVEFMKQMRYAADDEVLENNYRLRHSSGKWRWFHIRGMVFRRDDNGMVKQVMTISQDISAQRETEEQIRDQAEFMQNIFDVFPDMISVVNCETQRVEYVNFNPENQLGYTRDELMHTSVSEREAIVHPDDVAAYRNFRMTVQEGSDKEVYETELRMLAKDGSWKWVHLRGKVFRRNEKGKVSHYLCIVQGISRQKDAEAKVREQEEIVHHMTEAAPSMISVTDLETGSVDHIKGNPSQLLGYTHDEVLSVNSRAVHPDDRTTLAAYYDFFSHCNDTDIKTVEVRMRSKDGDPYWFSLTGKVFRRSPSGEPTHCLNITQDISDRKMLEEQIRLWLAD